jgi:hypothetical protein
MPLPEPWHAVKNLLLKYVMGSDYNDNKMWTKLLVFGPYQRPTTVSINNSVENG